MVYFFLLESYTFLSSPFKILIYPCELIFSLYNSSILFFNKLTYSSDPLKFLMIYDRFYCDYLSHFTDLYLFFDYLECDVMRGVIA